MRVRAPGRRRGGARVPRRPGGHGTGLAGPACLDALDEAVRSGFVETTEEPGRFRFHHVLIQTGSRRRSARPSWPRSTWTCSGDGGLPRLGRRGRRRPGPPLAGRGRARPPCGGGRVVLVRARARPPTVAWRGGHGPSLRAGGGAGRSRRRSDGPPRLLLGAAAARLNCDDITESVERCQRAAEAVRPLDRGDLLAEAALVIDGRGGPALAVLQDLAVEALGHDDLDRATRARLLGQLAVCAFYLDPSQLSELSEKSLQAAQACGDPLALVTAARARQMPRRPRWSGGAPAPRSGDRRCRTGPEPGVGAGSRRNSIWRHRRPRPNWAASPRPSPR